MAMNYQTSDPIILGSGELYLSLSATPTENNFINIGAIDSGATITIGNEKKEIKSSNRGLIKKITVDKSVKFSTGIMTWVLENISKFLLGATYTNVDGTKKMVVSFNDESPIIYLRFVHKKKSGGTLTVNIYKAQFDSEIELVFDNENPTTVNYEFVGLADDDLNYVEFIETDE